MRGEPNVRLQLLMARSGSLDEDRDIAARSWALEALNKAYGEFLTAWEAKVEGWRTAPLQGAEALVERTRLIHEYRMFPFQDPGLPAELLPPEWQGRHAFDVFLTGFGLLRGPAVSHYRSVLRHNGEPQP